MMKKLTTDFTRVAVMEDTSFTFEPIGRVHSCYPEKFGIPKQPGIVKAATGWIDFFPHCNREEMFKGLNEFSHIWILFLFHKTVGEGWKPTVRPPRLGGQRRVGVFASRSPHRPNHIGMSVVRLENVIVDGGYVRLEISGVDLLDQTPVVDIKPYIPYSDIIEGAECGYTREVIAENMVVFSPDVEKYCVSYRQQTGRDLRELILQTLKHDPRPASQRSVEREYGMLVWNVNVRWRVSRDGFFVISCTTVKSE